MLMIPSLGISLIHLSIRNGTITADTRILAFAGPSLESTYVAPFINTSNKNVNGYLVCKPITGTISLEIACGSVSSNSGGVADFILLTQPFEI